MSAGERSDAISVLTHLRAVRSLSDEPVADDALDAILEVARWSGSSQNEQEWQLVVLRDRETLRRLSQASPSAGHLAGAPLAIAIVMPGQRKILEAFDEGRMVERIMLAANACGLAAGMAWVSSDKAAAREALGLPADRSVRTVVTIGHPAGGGRRPGAGPHGTRRRLEETVHHERWGRREDPR